MIISSLGYLKGKPSGLSYLSDFIDATSEAELIATIDKQPWITELKRRVQHYGYRYDYKARSATSNMQLGEIPAWLISYAKMLHEDGIFEQMPDQIIVNEYEPGQGISSHVDCVPCFGKTVASLSLGSGCIMDLAHSKTAQKISQHLAPRSLVVLSGEARYEWKHGIASRKSDKIDGVMMPRQRRLSLTFRTMKF